jgi:hypothetical protein
MSSCLKFFPLFFIFKAFLASLSEESNVVRAAHNPGRCAQEQTLIRRLLLLHLQLIVAAARALPPHVVRQIARGIRPVRANKMRFAHARQYAKAFPAAATAMLRFRVAWFSRLPTTADCRISGNVIAVVVTRLAKTAMVGGGGGGGGGRIFVIVGSTALADNSRPGQEVVFLIFLLLLLLLIAPAIMREQFLAILLV